MLFAALVPKADYCESPVGLAAYPPHFLPSFLLSSWPVALTLHDFLPCSLKALSLWRTHLTRGESLKSLSTSYLPFSFWFYFIIPPVSTHTHPLPDLSGLKPSSAEASWFPLSRFYVQSMASVAINIGVQGSDSVAASAGAAPLRSNCPP